MSDLFIADCAVCGATSKGCDEYPGLCCSARRATGGCTHAPAPNPTEQDQ